MKLRCLVVAFLLIGSLAASGTARAQSSAGIVVEWNRLLTAALGEPDAHPSTISVTRPYAMMHIAIFDALNSIDPQFAAYLVSVPPIPGASRDAAAAQAAHDVAAALLPSQAARFDEALAATLARIEPAAAAAGSSIGAAAARAILASRADDGWTRTAPGYRMPNLPGYWQQAPTGNPGASATFVRFQFVQSFIVARARSLIVEAPPPLTSAQYATAFNQVKALGSATSTVRTAEQTSLARLWAMTGRSTTAYAAWNIAMQDLTRGQDLGALEAARMFALANMAAHDGAQIAFSGKFRYGLWRPVTAIREAARDNNPDTEADPEWLPLVTTPTHPTYPSDMACIGAAQARVLHRLFGRNDIPVTITWNVNGRPSVPRSYNHFNEIAEEQANSRIWAGVDFAFDAPASFGMCSELADYAVANYLRRR